MNYLSSKRKKPQTLCKLSFVKQTMACSLLLISFLATAEAQVKVPVKEQPNIIFIFADDWGMGDLASHGHPFLKTPVLDQLAKEGTDFSQFTVNSPVCSPSRAAVLTGKYPARNQVHQHFASKVLNEKHNMPDWLESDKVMLPRLLQQAGYKTAHYGKWHLTNMEFPNAPQVNQYGYDDSMVWAGPTTDFRGTAHALLTKVAVDKTISFIEKNKQQPFFVNLWIHESHTPIKPTEAMKAEYPDTPEPYKSYYAVITEADKQIGRLLTKLNKLGLDDNTLIVFSSDNGPELPQADSKRKTYYSRGSTGGLRGQKRSLMQGGVSVPFIVRWPGYTPTNKIDHSSVLTAVDLLPTFVAAAGGKLPQGYQGDGENILAAFKGENFTRSKAVFWDWRGYVNPKRDHWAQVGMREGEWKLLMTADGKRRELYNLKHNRFEQNDLQKQYPQVAKNMVAVLKKWQQELPQSPYFTPAKKGRKGKQANK